MLQEAHATSHATSPVTNDYRASSTKRVYSLKQSSKYLNSNFKTKINQNPLRESGQSTDKIGNNSDRSVSSLSIIQSDLVQMKKKTKSMDKNDSTKKN